jgi:hypothetical protein
MFVIQDPKFPIHPPLLNPLHTTRMSTGHPPGEEIETIPSP